MRQADRVFYCVLGAAASLTAACATATIDTPASAPPAVSASPARAGSPAAATAAARQPAPQVTDLMPAFWSFWERAEGAQGMERVRLFKELAIAPHREFYEKVIQIPSDERLDQILVTLAPAIPALRRIDREFAEQLPRAFASFLAACPDMDATLPV